MIPLDIIKATWGDSFERVPGDLIAPSTPEVLRSTLTTVGLPIGPVASLTLNLRFETVEIKHNPTGVRLLRGDDFETESAFPNSGRIEFDAKFALGRFLLLGEFPNNRKGSGFQTRYVCVDAESEGAFWVYPKLYKGCIDAYVINSNVHSYLASLLAYKKFRDQWPALMEKYPEGGEYSHEDYERAAKPIHDNFLQELEEADPTGFKNGFWEEHAWNEAILLEI